MEAIRFKTHIKKDHNIPVPESIVLPEAEAEVIILIERAPLSKTEENIRWERWIKQKPLAGGTITPWKRDEIYGRS